MKPKTPLSAISIGNRAKTSKSRKGLVSKSSKTTLESGFQEVLEPSFFDRRADSVARELLGCWLIVQRANQHQESSGERGGGDEDAAGQAGSGVVGRDEGDVRA